MGIPESRQKPLRICVLGLGGGGFHRQLQEILSRVRRPLELILIFSGPGGGITTWELPHPVVSRHVIRGPSLWGDGPAANASHALVYAWGAARILWRDRPDLILAVGSTQAIPFAFVSAGLSIPVWFVESLTRVSTPSRTGRFLYRSRLCSRFYYYWPELSAYYPEGRSLFPDK